MSMMLSPSNVALAQQFLAQINPARAVGFAGPRMGLAQQFMGAPQAALGMGGQMALPAGSMGAIGPGARAIGAGALEGAPFSLARQFAGAGAARAGAMSAPVAAAGAGGAGGGGLGPAGAILAGGGGAGGGGLGGISLANIMANAKGLGLKGFALRGGLPLAAGSLVSDPLIKKLVPGEGGGVEKGLSGAAKGAMVGAALGAPLLGIGAVPAALGGAALGGLASLLGGGKKDTQGLDQLQDTMAEAGIDGETGAAITRLYKVMDDGTEEGQKAAYDAARQQILAYVTQGSLGAGGAPKAWTPEQIMALQVQSAQFLKPYAEQAQAQALQSGNMINSLTQNMDPAIRDLLRAGAAGEITAAQRLSNAYMTQASLSPTGAAFQQQQQYQDQISNQLMQQAIGNIINPQSAGNDLGSLLASQAGQ